MRLIPRQQLNKSENGLLVISLTASTRSNQQPIVLSYSVFQPVELP